MPCDTKSKKVNLVELKKYINWYGAENVAAIGVSAPNFPNGMMDDIEAASLIALVNGIPVHVDACMGGFINMFCEEIKADFQCKGVTSISLDSHKYGMTGKGSSICVFRKTSEFSPTMEYLNHEAGVYATTGISGSTRGETVLELYAMLTRLGKDYWVKAARDIIKTTRDLATEVDKIPGVKVIGNAAELTCIIAVELDQDFYKGKKAPNIHAIADELQKRLGAGFQYMSEGFHLTVASNHVQNPDYVKNFKTHLRDITANIDPDIEPTSRLGSAYLQMGKLTLFGFAVVPSAISKQLAEHAMNAVYDFQPDPKVTMTKES